MEWLYGGDYGCAYPSKVADAVDTEAPEGKSLPARKSWGKGKGKKNGGYRSYASSGATSIEPPLPPIDDPDVLPTVDDDSAIPLEWTPNGYVTGRHATSAKKSSNPQRQTPIQTLPPALTRLQDLTFSGCRPLGKISQAEEYDKWTGHQLWRPDELDYEATFTTHANMYIMANQYMLDDLKNMAWQRLKNVLIGIGTPAQGSPVPKNLATLIHLVYQETGSPDGDEAEEPLRMLVTSFAALHFTSLRGLGFQMLAAEMHPEFMVDLMERVAQHVVYLETGEQQDASFPGSSAKKKVCGKKVDSYEIYGL